MTIRRNSRDFALQLSIFEPAKVILSAKIRAHAAVFLAVCEIVFYQKLDTPPKAVLEEVSRRRDKKYLSQ